MASVKLAYAASSAVTCAIASLATDANLLAGCESATIDNSSNLYLDYLLAGKVTTGTTPTTGKEIRIYAVGMMEDSTWPDVFDGTTGAETIATVGQRDSICKIVTFIPTVATSDQTTFFGPISIAAVFGGTVPRKWSLFVTHNTGVNLNSTGSNHAFYITPVYETVA